MIKKTFKRMLLLFLAITIPCAAFSCNSFGNTEYAVVSEGNVSADGFIYDKYENSTVRITGKEEFANLLVIPEEIDGMPVVEIGKDAFADNEKIYYVEFPKTDIKLGEGAFRGCAALLAVNFYNSVKAISESAFEGCVNLVLIENAESVTEIAAQAFADCASLAKFDIPAKLERIGIEAFRGCTSLASVTIPETVTEFAESAFWGCTNLVSADIRGEVVIPEYCFLSCTALTEVIIGDKVTAIGAEAFRGCRALYSVEIGSGVKEIRDYAFHACDELSEVRLPQKNNVKIGEGNESLGNIG